MILKLKKKKEYNSCSVGHKISIELRLQFSLINIGNYIKPKRLILYDQKYLLNCFMSFSKQKNFKANLQLFPKLVWLMLGIQMSVIWYFPEGHTTNFC